VDGLESEIAAHASDELQRLNGETRTIVEPMQLNVAVAAHACADTTVDSFGAVENMRLQLISDCQLAISLASLCDNVKAMTCALKPLEECS